MRRAAVDRGQGATNPCRLQVWSSGGPAAPRLGAGAAAIDDPIMVYGGGRLRNGMVTEDETATAVFELATANAKSLGTVEQAAVRALC